MLTAQEESFRQPEIDALLLQSDAFAASLYPNEYRLPLNLEEMVSPGICLLVARIEGLAAAGCCILLDQGDGTAELKRMIVDQGLRRHGVGQALLQAVETVALTKKVYLIRMEVGTRNTDGQALYRVSGYKERGPFGSHRCSPLSLFFEKSLDDAPGDQA